MGRLLEIATHKAMRAELQPLTVAEVTLEKGVADDFRGQPGERQVTVLGREGWQAACAELELDLPWTLRRANFLIEGVDLQQTAGKVLAIGDVRLLITRETDPCERMDEQQKGLTAALATEWRGGVCCRVLTPGRIEIGDNVELLNAE